MAARIGDGRDGLHRVFGGALPGAAD